MRWAVTGAGGMLGRDMVQVLLAEAEEVRALDRADLDVKDAEACVSALAGVDAVVNCAAWTDVDRAESHGAESFAINACGAANVARACTATGAIMVQVSTDYVFRGDASEPYGVDTPLDPINVYGRSKAAGEWAVRAECERSYVVRAAWLYGEHGPNFVRTMLRLATERETVEVVDDQRGQPTWTLDLAAFVQDLVEGGSAFGVYHGTAAGETTWYGFAREIFLRAGLDPNRVRPATSDHFPRPATRPAYSVLDGSSRRASWDDALGRALPLFVIE